MKKLLTLAALPLLALSLSACALFEANELQTITDIVVATPDTTTLEAAVVEAGLAGALDDPEVNYTVFAPTEAAFAAALDELGVDAAALLGLPNLADILLYHVVDGELFAADVIDAAPTTVTTLQTGTIDVAVVDGNVELTDALDRVITVVDTDINAYNGVIHLIDNVLLPFNPLD